MGGHFKVDPFSPKADPFSPTINLATSVNIFISEAAGPINKGGKKWYIVRGALELLGNKRESGSKWLSVARYVLWPVELSYLARLTPALQHDIKICSIHRGAALGGSGARVEIRNGKTPA